MPVKLSRRAGKYRLVEKSGRIAKNRSGTAIDGGGHSTRKKALSQLRAVNRRK